MSSKKILGLVLLLGGLALGYMGFDKVSNSGASVEVMDVEMGVSNDSAKSTGYIMIALGVVLFGGGVYTMNKKG